MNINISDCLEPLECRVCSNLYNTSDRCPRILRCGHTYCSTCLKTLAGKKGVECPECRKHHKVRLVSAISRNLSMEEVMEHVGLLAPSEDTAGLCTQHKAFPLYFYCRDHETWICYMCRRQTHKSTSSDQTGCRILSYHDYLAYNRDKGNSHMTSEIAKYNFAFAMLEIQKTNVDTSISDCQQEIETLYSKLTSAHKTCARLMGDRAAVTHLQKMGRQVCQQLQQAHQQLNTNNLSLFTNSFKNLEFWQRVAQEWSVCSKENLQDWLTCFKENHRTDTQHKATDDSQVNVYMFLACLQFN